MSMRTIVEFNHDYAYEIKTRPDDFTCQLGYALNSGDKESWENLRRYGVTRVVMVHHSTDRKVVAAGTEFKIG